MGQKKEACRPSLLVGRRVGTTGNVHPLSRHIPAAIEEGGMAGECDAHGNHVNYRALFGSLIIDAFIWRGRV